VPASVATPFGAPAAGTLIGALGLGAATACSAGLSRGDFEPSDIFAQQTDERANTTAGLGGLNPR
jgi:hypothetical protein